ncbi:MAG TPA: molybdopterin oxidoreductase, partial [Thermoanaerobaculia bacterium]
GFTLSGYATGVLVESNTGRPTKVEGNPQHPASLGATDLFAQASILSIYDPDRSQTITKLGQIRTWPVFAEELSARVQTSRAIGGEGFRLLTSTVTSPALAAKIRELLAILPKARWHQWEPAGRDAARAGARLAFGQAVEIRYDFGKADVVVSLDADPLAFGPGALANARAFARRRRDAATGGAAPPRYYAIETTPTSSGALADHRVSLKPSQLHAAAAALSAAIAPVAAGARSATDARFPWVAACAADLTAHPGRGLVIPGEHAPAEVHAIAHLLNDALSNLGATVLVTDPVEAEPVDQLASLASLVADMKEGKVDSLLILGGNPAFDAPADLGFVEALQKVAFRARLGLYDDETSQYCQWQVNETHELEAWGDARAFDGTVTILQPLIEPLYGGKSALEVLAAALGQPAAKGLDLVKAHWQKQHPEGFDAFFRKSLHDGFIAGSALPARGFRPKAGVPAPTPVSRTAADGLEIVFRPDPGLFDGRFANNGWLQEVPKPLTKLTWDNAAHVSDGTAKRLGVGNEDLVRIAV